MYPLINISVIYLTRFVTKIESHDPDMHLSRCAAHIRFNLFMSLHVDLNSVALVTVSKAVIVVLCYVKIIEVLLLQPVLVPILRRQI